VSPTLPTLTGDRVALRWLTDADLDRLLRIFGDPDVARFMGIPQLETIQDAQDLLRGIEDRFSSRELFQWGLVLRASDELVGTCTLARISWTNERAEIGFALGPSWWGQGLMTDALHLVLDHAFETMRLNRVEADVDPRNGPSLRLLERLGFGREGYMKERHLIAGERQDTIFYGLLARDWRARASRPSPK